MTGNFLATDRWCYMETVHYEGSGIVAHIGRVLKRFTPELSNFLGAVEL